MGKTMRNSRDEDRAPPGQDLELANGEGNVEADKGDVALDLLDDPERVAGARRMCDDIVAGFIDGKMKFYQIRARKPDS